MPLNHALIRPAVDQGEGERSAWGMGQAPWLPTEKKSLKQPLDIQSAVKSSKGTVSPISKMPHERARTGPHLHDHLLTVHVPVG